MSEMSPAAIPAASAPAVAKPAVGEVCPTCGRKVPGPSVWRKVMRGLRVIVHDPVVDRQGKQLAAIIAARVLVYVGASDGVVQIAKAVAHSVGVPL